MKKQNIWDILPKTRKVDTLSTSIDSYFTPIANTEYGQQMWSYYNKYHPEWGYYNSYISYNKGSSKYTRQSAGYGLKMDLKDDEGDYKLSALSGYMYFNRKYIYPDKALNL